MKILYARNAPYKPNVNSYNVQPIGFCKELCKKGIDCDILFYSDENRDECIYEYNGKRVVILWRKGYKILRTGYYPKLLNKAFTKQYDYIITTEYNQIMSLLWARYHDKVILYNGPYYNMFVIPFMEKVYDYLFAKKIRKRMYKTFTKSVLAKEYLLKRGFQDIEVLGVGLNIDVFNNEYIVPDEIENVIKYVKNNKCILYVGQIIDRKNFKFTLNVFKRIYEIDKEIKLVVIGNGKEEYVKQCFDSVSKDVIKNILHIKRIDNKFLGEIYKNSEVFILPAKNEIFGMVLLEAMYFGLPVVTTENGGSTTLVTNNVSGVVVDNFDEEQWIEKIVRILNDSNYKGTLSKNSIKVVTKEYTWESICNKFCNKVMI